MGRDRARARREAYERLRQRENENYARITLPNPEFRQRVRALAESHWREPVVVIHLAEAKPRYNVPGRRKDGTIEGEKIVRRSFWAILRGVINGVFNIFLIFVAGGAADLFDRPGNVTGPANAHALGLADAVNSADTPWLVYSPSRVGVVDSGGFHDDPADSPPPNFLWQAASPHLPRISVSRVEIDDPHGIASDIEWLPHSEFQLSWPDGSVFDFKINSNEAKLLDPRHLTT